MSLFSFLLMMVIAVFIEATVQTTPTRGTSRQRLLVKLADFANKQQNLDELPTHVMVKLFPIKIQDLNERNEILETTIRLQMTWKDSRLAWDAAMFGNFTELVIPGSSLWVPDVSVLNSVSDVYHVVQDTRFRMKVEHTGRVWWHVTGVVKTYCKLHLRYFPFDRQECSIVLESSTLSTNFMLLTTRSPAIDTSMYIGGETWNLLSVKAYDATDKIGRKTFFSRTVFVISIERAKIYHVLTIIMPACFLSMVQVMFFLLPATHPQRVGSSTTTLLSVVVFNSMAYSQLPKTSTDIPLLAVYVLLVTCVSGLSVCTSVFVAKFAVYADQNRKMPTWLRQIPHPLYISNRRVIRKPASAMTLTTTLMQSEMKMFPYVDENSDAGVDEQQEIKTANSSDVVLNSYYLFNTWRDVSWFVDFGLMILALAIAVLSPFIMFIVIPQSISRDHEH